MTPPRSALGSARLSIFLVVAAMASLLVGGFVFQSRQPKQANVTEYAMPVANDTPVAIAAAPDGTMWFSVDFSNVVGRIRNGKVERLTKPGNNVDALGLAVDGKGNAWYGDAPAGAILRIAPDGTQQATPLGTAIARIGRMAASPDGSIWFAESTAYSVTQLKDGKLVRHELDETRGPFGVTVAPDGTAWATLQGSNGLLRIAPDGKMQEFEIPTRGAGPSDIAVGPDGAVWFLQFRTNRIGRYANGQFTEFPVPEVLGAISGLVVTVSGDVWFGAIRGAALAKLRDGRVTVYKLPRQDARPFTLALDPAGHVWYADIRGFVGMMAPGQ